MRSRQRKITNELIHSYFSFKKLALRHHPMKHPNEMKIHVEKFHLLCEAYQVLSNRKFSNLINIITAKHKIIYDQHGEDTLRLGVKDSTG